MLTLILFVAPFFFNDTATTEIYTLSLHDALPISWGSSSRPRSTRSARAPRCRGPRSEEHTSELQSHSDLVCRLLLEKKKTDLDHGRLSRLQNNAIRAFGPEDTGAHDHDRIRNHAL